MNHATKDNVQEHDVKGMGNIAGNSRLQRLSVGVGCYAAAHRVLQNLYIDMAI
jgi:hypothetical protein